MRLFRTKPASTSLRRAFGDKAAVALKFYTTDQLGPKRQRTPEGYIVCLDVPIARTGDMLYAAHELAEIEADERGIITIQRTEDEVFRAETVASFAGKPIVLHGHPREGVNPRNWRDLAVGIVMNPRRGTGAETDLLLADLMFTAPEGIVLVDEKAKNLPDVSCGYEAGYVPVRKGVGRQVQIIGDHLAIVAAGRCGPRCAIGDAKPESLNLPPPVAALESKSMKKSLWKKFLDSLSVAFDNGDKEAFQAAIADAPEPEQHITLDLGDAAGGGQPPAYFTEHVAQNQQKFTALEESLKAIRQQIGDCLASVTTQRTGDAAELAFEADLKAEVGATLAPKITAKTGDSALLVDAHRATVAGAEVLCPGILLPDFDAKRTPKLTLDSLCELRRKSLEIAYLGPEMRVVLDRLLKGAPLEPKNLTCDAARTLFISAVEVRRQANNAVQAGGGKVQPKAESGKRPQSPAELNKFYDKHWGRAAA